MPKVCRRRHKIHPSTEKAAAPGPSSSGPVTVASALRSLARLLGLGLLYPLVPVALQLRLLCSEAGEAELEVARETSLIFVTVEASLQTLLTLWLMLRGIIRSVITLILNKVQILSTGWYGAGPRWSWPGVRW